MVYVRILWVGPGHQRGHLNALLEFTGNMPEIGRSDFEPFSFADALPEFIGPLQILVAKSEIAKITVRGTELQMCQCEFAVQFDGPFEGRDRFSILTLASQFNPERKILESRQRCGRRLFNGD